MSARHFTCADSRPNQERTNTYANRVHPAERYHVRDMVKCLYQAEEKEFDFCLEKNRKRQSLKI